MSDIANRMRNLQGCGFVPGKEYHIKLRRNISLCLTVDNENGVCLGNDFGSAAALWRFVFSIETEERIKDPDGNWGLFLGDKNGLGEFRYDSGDIFRGIFKGGEFREGVRRGQNGTVYTLTNGKWASPEAPNHAVVQRYENIDIVPKDGYFFICSGNCDVDKPFLSCTKDGLLQLSNLPSLWSVELHGRWCFLAFIEKDSGMHLAADHYAFPSASPKSRSQHITSAYSQESSQDDRRAYDEKEAQALTGIDVKLRKYVSNMEWETRHWRAVPVGGPVETVICIGDLHGHIDRCNNLWAKLQDQLGKERLDAATVIFLGDYCDRGPNTKAVYDWLIEKRDSRSPNKTLFVTGNHDFAFASFIGCPPFECPEGFDLDTTNSGGWKTGVWAFPVSGGMHYQGRRWGGARDHRDTYNAQPTFASYGVINDYTAQARERLIAAVPQSHKDFLSNLNWIQELDVSFPPGKLIAIHAGIRTDRPAEPQLALLKARRVDAVELQDVEFGRLPSLSGRSEVVGMHPDLDGKVIMVSGHHGDREINGDRFINDLSGGKVGRPLEALIFPERQWISTDEIGCDSESREKVNVMNEIRSIVAPRLQAAWEAGLIPGAEYHIKLRKNMVFCLNARSAGEVQIWDSLGLHERWTFEIDADGYFKLRSRFHADQGDGACSYLAHDPSSGCLSIAEEGSLFSIELHGRLHFIALVEKQTGKHVALEFGLAPRRGANVTLETYTHDANYEHRHWSLSLVPVDPAY